MNIRETIRSDIEKLELVYKAAFASNSRYFPQNMNEEENEDDVDLSPEIAWGDPKTVQLSFECNTELIGGAIITCSDTAANTLDRLYVAPDWQGKGIGLSAWKYIEEKYFNKFGWRLVTPTCLINNACFYINKCGFVISEVTDVADDGVGMFVFTKQYIKTV